LIADAVHNIMNLPRKSSSWTLA